MDDAFDPALIRQLRGVFHDEAGEMLERLASLLRGLRGGEQAASVRPELMRIAHTIKGDAASVGYEQIAVMAHHIEDLIHEWPAEQRGAPANLDACEQAVSDICAIVEEHRTAGAEGGQQAEPAEDEPMTAEAGTAPRGSAASSAGPRAGAVRVDAERLDRVMAHAGDLITVREELGALRSSLEELRNRFSAVLDDTGLQQHQVARRLLGDIDAHLDADQRSFSRLSRVSQEVAESVRQLRLVSLDTVVPTWERAVADAARQTGKQVRLVANARDLEVDKHVIDALRDPVIHLLRNSVDHGIETAPVRAELGKPAVGTVVIDAEIDDGMLVVNVSDDGAGLDVERIRQAAVARGLLSPDRAAAASAPEVIEQLFAPGFTTTTSVSAVSGRGVGLDVVRQAAEACRGYVEANPHGPLGGASFRMVLSVDVLWTRVTLLRSNGATYALPVEAVDRMVRVAAGGLVSSGDALYLQLDAEAPLRIEALDALTGHGAARRAGALTIAVLASGTRRLGIIVDEVLGAEDVVVRRLPWNLTRLDGVSGGCLLPGGQVAMVLDPHHLVSATGAPVTIAAASAKASNRCVLVVDDSSTARALARSALVAAGWQVELAADGNQAWAALQRSSFGLLVSDIQMPGMDGFELTRKVRSDPRLARLPVILVTSRSTREDVERGLAVGADEYIVKGTLQQQQLVEAVARHL